MNNWVILAILSAFFASLVAIFGKVGISKVDTTLATTVRSIIMSLFLILIFIASGKISATKTLDPKAFLFIIFSGVSGALSWLFYFYALKAGSAQIVAALDRLSVVFVFVLAAIFLKEGATLKSTLGIIFILTGAILMTLK